MNWHEKHRVLWLTMAERAEDLITQCRNVCLPNEEDATWIKDGRFHYFMSEYKQKLIQELWPGEPYIRNGCFACAEADKIIDNSDWLEDEDLCDICPLRWPDDLTCDDDDSLYDSLTNAILLGIVSEVAEICIQIAEVPACSDKELEEKIHDTIDG